MSESRPRLDKWLWCARFYKTRTLAADACASGRIRVNGTPITKPHHGLKEGDVLTFPLGPHIRIIRVVAFACRRGPYSEARLLYDDLSPPQVGQDSSAAVTPAVVPSDGRPAGSGRPTKAERRAVDRLRGFS